MKGLLSIFLYGFLLWLLGYVLGIVFFFIFPKDLIGWVIMPLGIISTLFVLNKVKFKNYFLVAIIWTLSAIIFDYLFLVKLLQPADRYYKIDVYLYYLITFLLPIIYSYKGVKR